MNFKDVKIKIAKSIAKQFGLRMTNDGEIENDKAMADYCLKEAEKMFHVEQSKGKTNE